MDTLTALGVYTFVRSEIPQNAPPDLIDGGKVYVVAGNSAVALRQKIVSVYGVEYSRTRNDPNSAWRTWTKTALVIPPQEFDLPLAEGVGDSAKYSKDQLGRVQLRGWITGATADTVVATLPAGFRPASAAHFIQAISSSSQCGIARVIVRPDGTIYVELPQNGTLANGLSLQLSFLAG